MASSPTSAVLHQQFVVPFAYDVYFTTGLLRQDNPILATVMGCGAPAVPKKVFAVIDAGVARHHPMLPEQLAEYADSHAAILRLAAEPLVVPGGELCKNTPELPEQILGRIHELGLCRHSYVMAIGGGAVLDMVGYAAAIAHRGVRLLRVPTTVLSQNDSGVGVKNGINAFNKKNFLGVFAPPYAVLNDFSFLTTLEPRDWRSGIAEAIKVALIKDPGFFEFIERQAQALAQRDLASMQQLIQHCAQLHLEHIAGHGDPFEFGSSRPLDFGHWSAHKLEQLTHYDLRHGEAVAIGIALDSIYSHLAGWLAYAELERILTTLRALGFRLYVPELHAQSDNPDDPHSLFAGLHEFREHLGGRLTLLLLAGIGRPVEVHQIALGRYRLALDWLAAAHSKRLALCA